MRRFMGALFGVSVIAMMPVIAGAAGTYYDGNLYQKPQSYGTNRGGYYNSYGAGRSYDQSMQNMGTSKYGAQAQNAKKSAKNGVRKQGLYLDANFTHEMANWDLEMNTAGSKLRYDNLTWNVVSADGVYYLETETPMQIKFGARYGKQYGKTSMIDDDVSNGAYDFVDYDEGRLSGYAMSVGTSDGGSQYGFNVAFGLTDFFKSGGLKVTPSIGYRYFKHELTTKNNSGLTMDVFMSNTSQSIINCISDGGETQCDPFVNFMFSNTIDFTNPISVVGGRILYNVEYDDSTIETFLSEIYAPNSGTTYVAVDLGDTYYYSQAGTSHKYETSWAGPYLALDMEYEINNDNMIRAGVEFGLPIYNSKGDQPYRVDWAHPTSVEDKGSIGDAYHLGLNASWSTAITDNMMFTLGMTYDYYNVKKATATTYLNPSYYQLILDDVNDVVDTLSAVVNPTPEQVDLLDYYLKQKSELDTCKSQGWKTEAKDEIESIYKSMGVRAGITIKF